MIPKFSIIMPCYNSEKWVGRAIDSVLNQTNKNLELIIIDDCSTDGSLEILKQYKKKDKRVKILEHKKNSGLSATRNSGLKIAKGTWVGFIDSDDEYDINMIETISSDKNFEKSDMTIFGYRSIYSNSISDRHYERDEVISIEKFKSKFEDLYFKLLVNSAWNKIYKLEIIKNENIYFLEKPTIVEDIHFNLRYYNKIKNIFFSKGIFYNYYHENSESILRKEIGFDRLCIDDLSLVYKNFFCGNTNEKLEQGGGCDIWCRCISFLIYGYVNGAIVLNLPLKNKIKRIKEASQYRDIYKIARKGRHRRYIVIKILYLKNSYIILFLLDAIKNISKIREVFKWKN